MGLGCGIQSNIDDNPIEVEKFAILCVIMHDSCVICYDVKECPGLVSWII